MRIRLCAAAGIFPLVITGLGCTTSAQMEMELSRLRREVRQAKAQTRELRAKVERLDGQMAIVRAKNRTQTAPRTKGAKDTALKATVSQPVAHKLPELPVVRLNAEMDTDETEDNSVMIKLGPSNKLPIDRSVLKKKDPVLSKTSKKANKKTHSITPSAKNNETSEYEAALAMLRNKGQPAEARELFRAFRAKHPDSRLNVNVAYWMAESRFMDGEHAKAVDAFLSVAESYPRSMKAADAILRVAQIWQQRGDEKRAIKIYTKVKDKYPNSEAAKLADVALTSYDKKAK